MPGVRKTKAEAMERATLNTTIRKDVMDKFRDTCRQSGIAMNVLLETFMKQYTDGEFQIRFTNNMEFHLDVEE